MQLEGYKPKKVSHNPVGDWARRLLVVAAFAAAGWYWWMAGLSDRPAPTEKFSREITTNTSRPVSIQTPATNRPFAPVTPPVPAVFSVTNRAVTPGEAPGEINPRPPRTPFEIQLALDRIGFSSGSIDGQFGSQTRAAVRAFQLREHLPATGQSDSNTLARLTISDPWTNYVLRAEDFSRLRPLGQTWLAKSQQDRLDYETVLELIAEKFHTHPRFLAQVNPALDWRALAPGASVKAPRTALPLPPERPACIRISLSLRSLEIFGASSNLLAHFPCSIAERVEKRPAGQLEIVDLIPNPNYLFQPENFPESTEANLGKMSIPPGPNNPVGTAWIQLSKAGYGIHGTPKPEEVGRTFSHGCFRLANWNAELLLKWAWVGMPVYVDP